MQGPFYCGVGAESAFGRPLAEAHLDVSVHLGYNSLWDFSGVVLECCMKDWGSLNWIAPGILPVHGLTVRER